VDGLYAAGDVCVKQLRQVVTAVGDGALAATELEKYAAAMHRKTGLHPRMPQSQPRQEPPKSPATDSALFDDAMLTQLNTVFARMAEPLVLKLYLDNRPVSAELNTYMVELAKLTDKLTVEIQDDNHGAPCVQVCRADGTPTGLAFHGVPGGHEFTSFILGLYNAAGPGQPLDADVRAAIHSLGQKNMKVLVSLNCTMCPELVTAAQRIAAENKNITAEVFDINHFPELRETYNVMSVPCLILNDGETVTFGKKNIRQLLDILK
jgi:thioredoxin reductase (NADPH)